MKSFFKPLFGANPYGFFLLLLALFVAGCALNHYLGLSANTDGFQRLYALIPVPFFLAVRLLFYGTPAKA